MSPTILPFPAGRSIAIDAMQMTTNGLVCIDFLEADVTAPRQTLKAAAQPESRPLSFTAYVIACYARALMAHPKIQAFWRFPRQLVVYDEVDVSIILEDKAERGIPSPHIIRGAQALSVRQISEEVRAAQADPDPFGRKNERLIPLFAALPRPLRRLFFQGMRLNPDWIRQIQGTTNVSSVGMFGKGLTWAVGNQSFHSVSLWVGSIVRKPMNYNGEIALRDCLYLAISFDHAIVDGAPASRFAATFVELLESGSLLEIQN